MGLGVLGFCRQLACKGPGFRVFGFRDRVLGSRSLEGRAFLVFVGGFHTGP